jgi:hypothetical protein
VVNNRVIPREEWGSRYAPSGYKRKIGALDKWLHHSVTVAPDVVPPYTDDYAAVRAIEAITEGRFKIGMAYTFLITPAGLVFEGHPIDQVGAHTGGRNTGSAGICLVGNYEKDDPTDAQMRALDWLLHHGKSQGWWQRANLQGGHRDTKATACPGRNAYMLIDDVNDGKFHDSADFVSNPITPSKPEPKGLKEDGFWGGATTRRAQQVLGTTVDGIVSSQPHPWKGANPGLTTGWEWTLDPEGSELIGAIQEILGVTKDYMIGPETITAFQKRMGTTADGELWRESPAIKELQRRLNKGKI